ncbi:MAG: hypothetical protein A2Y33_10275 [Spirochaetes bacterium GWF1_51_8]|nr:MAG: hypothetical protein A2Y33_10275 [Spirochaetes bacterium GWF1_51_8]
MILVIICSCDLFDTAVTETDKKRPTVTIIDPQLSESTFVNPYYVWGIAEDDLGVQGVYLSVNGSGFEVISGTEFWGKDVVLKSGVKELNTIKVYAVDTAGKSSATNTRNIYMCNKLVPLSAGEHFGFGSSVAVNADSTVFAVGSPYVDNEGAVFVYRWVNGQWQITKISASDGFQGDHFGIDVDISDDGNVIVAGADQDIPSGCAYILTWNGSTWDEKKVSPSDGSTMTHFGESVAISGDGTTIVCGCSWDNEAASYAGAIYIYTGNLEFLSEDKITPAVVKSDLFFGCDVDVSRDGKTVVAGAFGMTNNGYSAGCVYAYKLNGFTWEESKLLAGDPQAYDYLGMNIAVSADGNTVAAGAKGSDSQGTDCGAVYVFTYFGASWSRSKISIPGIVTNGYFGCSISLNSNGNTVAVGAKLTDNFGADSGSAYVCTKSGLFWDTELFLPSTGKISNTFGYSVCISPDGKTMIAGSELEDDKGLDTGAAWIFQLD